MKKIAVLYCLALMFFAFSLAGWSGKSDIPISVKNSSVHYVAINPDPPYKILEAGNVILKPDGYCATVQNVHLNATNFSSQTVFHFKLGIIELRNDRIHVRRSEKLEAYIEYKPTGELAYYYPVYSDNCSGNFTLAPAQFIYPGSILSFTLNENGKQMPKNVKFKNVSKRS